MPPLAPTVEVIQTPGQLELKGAGWIPNVQVNVHFRFSDADGTVLDESDGGGNRAKADGTFDWPIATAWMGEAFAAYWYELKQGGTVVAQGSIKSG